MAFVDLFRKDGYQHRQHNKNSLMAHLIFVTKYRKKLLTGSVREDILQIVYETCQKNHWYIRRMETDIDHIHILLQYNPTDSVTEVVRKLKQVTTYHIWQRHEKKLKSCYWKERTFWSDGYFAASVGQVSQATIERYIENQG